MSHATIDYVLMKWLFGFTSLTGQRYSERIASPKIPFMNKM